MQTTERHGQRESWKNQESNGYGNQPWKAYIRCHLKCNLKSSVCKHNANSFWMHHCLIEEQIHAEVRNNLQETCPTSFNTCVQWICLWLFAVVSERTSAHTGPISSSQRLQDWVLHFVETQNQELVAINQVGHLYYKLKTAEPKCFLVCCGLDVRILVNARILTSPLLQSGPCRWQS